MVRASTTGSNAVSNHHIIAIVAKDLFVPSPMDTLQQAAADARTGEDNSGSVAVEYAGRAMGVVGVSTAAAGLAGAGALTGYAGMASAVSTLGLGGASTAVASAAGITAAGGGTLVGAAATTALTAAVGGPAVAAVVVVTTVGALGYVGYRTARWVFSLFE